MTPKSPEAHAQALDDLLERAKDGTVSPLRLRKRLGGYVPFWLPDALAERIGAVLGEALPREPARVGEALGVLAIGQEGHVVRLQAFIESTPTGERYPRDHALFSPGTVDSLHQAVAAVARLYPYPWVADPERDVRFECLDLHGRPLRLADPIRGGSLAVAALVATWSALCREAPARTVFTGALGLPPRGRPMTPVIEVEKVDIKRRAAASVGCSLVAPGDVDCARDAITEAFGEDTWTTACRPPRFDPRLALELTDLAYVRNGDGSSWRTLAQRFARLQDAGLDEAARIRAAARYGACLTHSYDYTGAIPVLEQALAWSKEHPDAIDAAIEVVTATHLGVAYRDAYRLREAETVLREAIALAHRTRSVVERVNAESTLGQLLVACGELEEGLALVRATRDFYVERRSFECPRNHTYLVTALVRSGDWAAARAEYDEGCVDNVKLAEPHQRVNNRAYLDLAYLDGQLRRLRAEGDRDAWRALDDDITTALKNFGGRHWPGEGLRRIAGAVKLRLEPERRTERATALLDEAASSSGLMAWQLALGALEVVHVAADLDEARAWVDRALGHLPDGAEAWHAQRLDAIRRAGDLRALQDAVGALVAAAQY